MIEYLANQGVDLNDDSLVEEIDYDALDDIAKVDQKLQEEKAEIKKEEAYIANFGEEPVEEETPKAPMGEPQIDFSKLNKPVEAPPSEKKEEVSAPTVEVPKVTEEDVNSFIAAIKKAQEVNNAVTAPTEEAKETPKVETPNTNEEFGYDSNLYSYDYSESAKDATPPASNPLDIEKTQYLDPVTPNTGSPNNV